MRYTIIIYIRTIGVFTKSSTKLFHSFAVTLPLSPLIATSSIVKPILCSFSLNLSTANCGLIYSCSAIGPTNVFTLFNTFILYVMYTDVTVFYCVKFQHQPYLHHTYLVCIPSLTCCLKVFIPFPLFVFVRFLFSSISSWSSNLSLSNETYQ